MKPMKNGSNAILFIKGLAEPDGDMNTALILNCANEEASRFANDLFLQTPDVWRMRHVVDHLSGLYKDHRYKRFEKLMEEMMSNAFMTWADIWNTILRSGDKEKLRVYECGFVSELNHQMEKIEMLVNAGLGKDNIVDEMGYTYG